MFWIFKLNTITPQGLNEILENIHQTSHIFSVRFRGILFSQFVTYPLEEQFIIIPCLLLFNNFITCISSLYFLYIVFFIFLYLFVPCLFINQVCLLPFPPTHALISTLCYYQTIFNFLLYWTHYLFIAHHFIDITFLHVILNHQSAKKRSVCPRSQ